MDSQGLIVKQQDMISTISHILKLSSVIKNIKMYFGEKYTNSSLFLRLSQGYINSEYVGNLISFIAIQLRQLEYHHYQIVKSTWI